MVKGMPEDNQATHKSAGPKQRRATVLALAVLGIFLVVLGLASFRALALFGVLALVCAGVLSIVFFRLDGMS